MSAAGVVNLSKQFATTGGYLGLLGGGKPGPATTSPLVVFGDKPKDVPYYTSMLATPESVGLSADHVSGPVTLQTPTGFEKIMPATIASMLFGAKDFGQPVQAIEGASEIWAEHAAGFLPDADPSTGVGGYSSAAVGQTAPGLGMGLPPWIWVVGGLAVGGALLFALRR